MSYELKRYAASYESMNGKLTGLQKLQEMKITLWQLRDPSYFSCLSTRDICLPNECKLLYISTAPPLKAQLMFLSKILASMNLKLEEAFFLPKEGLVRVKKTPLWCWFAGSKPHSFVNSNIIHSCDLKKLEYDNPAKRHLWQQIKSYDNTSSY